MGGITILESVRDDSATAVARAFVRCIAEVNAAQHDDDQALRSLRKQKRPGDVAEPL
jgi:hypothetical protein